MAKNSYAVFGLGTFGSKLAAELANAGHAVLVCDIDPGRVEPFADQVTQTVIGDAGNEDTIKELNVSSFDTVILSMSSHFEKQIMALTFLKQEGAKRILVKADTDTQERILYRLGADEVIQPEHDVARRLARRLALSNITDFFEFKGSAIAEVTVPEVFQGKTLRELDLRNRHQVSILLRRSFGSAEESVPAADTVLGKGDTLTIFGDKDSIIKLFKEIK